MPEVRGVVGMTWDAKTLRGKSVERARLYGMPHAGAEYVGERTDRYRKLDGPCVICGSPSAHVHHEPPRGMGGGGYLDLGGYSLRPALLRLCESCHRKRHDMELSITWEWEDPIFEEMWSTGHMLETGIVEPHDPELYGYGRWAVYVDGIRATEIGG